MRSTNILARQVGLLLNFFSLSNLCDAVSKVAPPIEPRAYHTGIIQRTVQAFHLFLGSAVHPLACNNNNITRAPLQLHLKLSLPCSIRDYVRLQTGAYLWRGEALGHAPF